MGHQIDFDSGDLEREKIIDSLRTDCLRLVEAHPPLPRRKLHWPRIHREIPEKQFSITLSYRDTNLNVVIASKPDRSNKPMVEIRTNGDHKITFDVRGPVVARGMENGKIERHPASDAELDTYRNLIDMILKEAGLE